MQRLHSFNSPDLPPLFRHPSAGRALPTAPNADMAAADDDCPFQNLPPEILGAIVKEATITEIDVCSKPNRCHRATEEYPPAIQNPNIGLLLTSKTLYHSFRKTCPNHKVQLQFCSNICARHHVENAEPYMFADLGSMSFKETMTTSQYNQVDYEETWDDCKREKWAEFVEITRGSAVTDVQFSARGGSVNTGIVNLVWTIPIS